MPLHPEHDRLQACLDGALPDSERVQFEARLGREPGLADALLLLAREEGIYAEWSSSRATTTALLCEARHSPNAVIFPAERRTRLARVRRGAIVCATVAALATIAVVVTILKQPGPIGPGVALASLEFVQGEVLLVSPEGAIRNAEAGQSLYAGHEIRTGEDGSSSVIRLLDSRLVLASETRIRIGPEAPVSDVGSGPLFFVEEGIVAAELAPRPDGRPTILSSPHAELRGSVGRFSFVSLPEKTHIESDDGTARVTRKSDGRYVDVKRGQFAVASHNEPLRSRNLPARLAGAKRTFAETGPVVGLFFDPEGTSLTSCAGDAIKRRALNTGWVVATIRPHAQPQAKKNLRSFAASLDGKLVAITVNEERQVKLYDAVTGEERATYRAGKRGVAVALSPDSRLLAISWTAKDSHELRLYDTALGVERVLETGHSGPTQGLSFSPRGNYIATCADRSVKVWQTDNLSLVRGTLKLAYEPRCLAFSPDERLLAVGDRKGAIHLLEIKTGSEKTVMTGHLREIAALNFSPDGLMIVSGAADGTARLWHVESGRELTTLKANSGNFTVSAASFSQDGRLVATGGTDRKILLWDVPDAPRP